MRETDGEWEMTKRERRNEPTNDPAPRLYTRNRNSSHPSHAFHPSLFLACSEVRLRPDRASLAGISTPYKGRLGSSRSRLVGTRERIRVGALHVLSCRTGWRRRCPPHLWVLLDVLRPQPQHVWGLCVAARERVGRVFNLWKLG